MMGCRGRVGMKGGSVGILEVKSVIEDPIFADAASRKSARLVTWISVWRCLRMKFSTNLLCLSISRAAAKSGLGTREPSALSDLVLNRDNSKLSSKSMSSKYLKTAGHEWDLNIWLGYEASLLFSKYQGTNSQLACENSQLIIKSSEFTNVLG